MKLMNSEIDRVSSNKKHINLQDSSKSYPSNWNSSLPSTRLNFVFSTEGKGATSAIIFLRCGYKSTTAAECPVWAIVTVYWATPSLEHKQDHSSVSIHLSSLKSNFTFASDLNLYLDLKINSWAYN